MAANSDREEPISLTHQERRLLANAHQALSLAQDLSSPIRAKWNRIGRIMQSIEDLLQPGS